LHPRLPYIGAEIVWGARNEMARTVDDALSRRTRGLILDARAAIEIAGTVARLMAEELRRDSRWIDDEVRRFVKLADGYLMTAEATVTEGCP